MNEVIIMSNLKAILEQRNISLKELSRRIDYNFEAVRRIANNKATSFSRVALAKICTELEITPNELLYVAQLESNNNESEKQPN